MDGGLRSNGHRTRKVRARRERPEHSGGDEHTTAGAQVTKYKFFQTNFATRSAHSDNFGSSLKDKTPKERIPTESRTAIPLACLASGDMGQESR